MPTPVKNVDHFLFLISDKMEIFVRPDLISKVN